MLSIQKYMIMFYETSTSTSETQQRLFRYREGLASIKLQNSLLNTALFW
jgi:hypothetical protein